MIANDLSQGRLVRLFDIGVSAPQAYHLVYPESSSQDPRVLAFREWMLKETGQPIQPTTRVSRRLRQGVPVRASQRAASTKRP